VATGGDGSRRVAPASRHYDPPDDPSSSCNPIVSARRSDRLAAIVLAAGSGARFGGAKQFATLAGERLVDRAVRLMTETIGPPVLALPPGTSWDGAPVLAVVSGGDSRTESVRRALAAVPDAAETVIVHDVARPLATAEQVSALVQAISDGADCALPTWPLPDTLKFAGPDGTVEHRGREGYVMAQTPMAFTVAMLRRVFETFAEVPIEESIAVERLGGRVVAIPGDRWSHHVVEPRDLDLIGRILAGEPEGAAGPGSRSRDQPKRVACSERSLSTRRPGGRSTSS
jgi:2-C-methyl-D-erythritol 4-phosphate cytidylyltransferase